MSLRSLLRGVVGFILATLLLFGLATVAGSTAQAQRRHRRIIIVRPVRPFHRFGYPWGYRNYNRYYGRYSHYIFSNGEEAVSQGYEDGLETGSKDGKKSKSYNPARSHYYHDAGFGNYAEAYRSGFDRGYRDGYGSRAG